MNCFARIVAHHPYIVLTAVAVFAGTCMVIPLATKNLPSFANPLLGFESRGTVIAQRLTAWKNLIEATTKTSGPLTVNPKGLPIYKEKELKQKERKAKNGKRNKKVKVTTQPPIAIPTTTTVLYLKDASSTEIFKLKTSEQTPDQHQDEINAVSLVKEDDSRIVFSNSLGLVQIEQKNDSAIESLKQDAWMQLEHGTSTRHSLAHFQDHDHPHVLEDGFFCSQPNSGYSRVVFQHTEGGNLFSLESIIAMCHVDEMLTKTKHYTEFCQLEVSDKCCHSWSIGNYIALLHNRSSCFDITEEDVNSTLLLLRECSFYFHNLLLTPDCPESRNTFCQQVPKKCFKHDAVYNILFYLVDTSFLPPNDSSNMNLTNAMLILPIAASSSLLDYYYSLNFETLTFGHVRAVAMELGLKDALLDECLVKDTWMIGAGGLFILILMWFYTGSLFITIMTIIAITFSLGISYFMYTLVFELKFFPFMNLLASIVAVGIGADDAFIFCKVWQCAKLEKNNGTLLKMVYDALSHATLSMFVTSLTTAAAFYASYISSITAIGCFSIFAGTATLANLALMITWLPASVVVSERICCSPKVPSQLLGWNSKLWPARAMADQARAFFDRTLLLLVIKLRYFWVIFLGGITVASCVVIFYHPKMKLPDSNNFQLFESRHPFEKYDLVYKTKFWFERFAEVDLNMKLPLRFVWGVLPVDNGDYLDPLSQGSLQFDSTFDMAAPESQEWLLHFCRNLRAQQFYESTLGPLLPNCFIESFISWMQRRCREPNGKIDRAPCCETSKFPYKRAVFERCIILAIANLYETPVEFFMPGVAGPKFSSDIKEHHRIKAVVVEYDSNHYFTRSFTDMHKFYQQVESWMENELVHAPPGMKNGWFTSVLNFYDLQLTLSKDTLIAIGVSMGIALIVLLLVTLNILISLYAIMTITSIIFVTVGVLVLLGWKLNVLESIAVSVAIGLAVDFSLHYGVHYRLSPHGKDRDSAVTYAISHMGGPTAMAALTTAAAGAFMLPSTVLAYIQIGIFLIVVMLVSWIYSTFYFGSLLRIAGPEHGFGQFAYPTIPKCCYGDENEDSRSSTSKTDRTDHTAYTNVLSESTLSTSSTMCALHPSASESHELEALTSRRPNSFSRRLGRSDSMSATVPSTAPAAFHVTRKISLPMEQSPSAASATTVILTDDVETEGSCKY